MSDERIKDEVFKINSHIGKIDSYVKKLEAENAELKAEKLKHDSEYRALAVKHNVALGRLENIETENAELKQENITHKLWIEGAEKMADQRNSENLKLKMALRECPIEFYADLGSWRKEYEDELLIATRSINPSDCESFGNGDGITPGKLEMVGGKRAREWQIKYADLLEGLKK